MDFWILEIFNLVNDKHDICFKDIMAPRLAYFFLPHPCPWITPQANPA
jgi:hypothetical protein